MLHNPDLDPILDAVYVRYWQLADVQPIASRVWFRAKSGRGVQCPLMTPTGLKDNLSGQFVLLSISGTPRGRPVDELLNPTKPPDQAKPGGLLTKCYTLGLRAF